MYPLLLEFSEQYQPADGEVLPYIIENIGKTTVKNGEFTGDKIKDTLRVFGKQAFGEKGIKTVFFRSEDVLFPLLDKIHSLLKQDSPESEDIIYPFGVVKNIVCDGEAVADRLYLNGRAGIEEEKSFIIIYAVDNDFLVSDFDSSMRVPKNYAVFVPAKTRVELNGEAEIILIHL